MLRFIHAADFHLDSAFAALTPRQAAARRRESRELPVRLANYVNQNNIDLVLLAGDLFDSAASYRDMAEELSAALGQMEAQVYIAPGNHDWYGPGSPYLTVKWQENVPIFTQPRLETMEWPEKKSGAPRCGLYPRGANRRLPHWLHRPRRREAPYRPAPRGD